MMDDVDRDLAIRTVLSEAGNQGPDGMAAVAAVIKNRTDKGKYGGKSPAEVVTARNQFEPWNDAGKGKPNDPLAYSATDPKYQQAARIVDGVFSGVLKDPTGGATHFYAPKAQADLGRNAPSWAKGQQGLKIGDHMFYSPDDPNGGDLGQGMGQISQTPQVASPPMQLPGAPTAPAAGGASPTNPLLALLQGGGQKASPQHGILNQLLFGPQGWQGPLGKAMPNGLLGGMFGGAGGGGGTPAPSPSPAGGGGGSPLAALFGLGGGGAGGGAPMGAPTPPPPTGMDVQGSALPPVGNPNAPMPPPRPTDLGGGSAVPAMAGGAPPMQLGGMGGGAGGGFSDILKSLFGMA